MGMVGTKAMLALLAISMLVMLAVSSQNTVMIEKKNDYDLLFRDKRNITATPDDPATAPSVVLGTVPASTGSEYLTVASMLKNKTNSTPPPQATATKEEPLPDFKSPNTFVRAVFEHSDSENMTVPLGLCRKNSDVKIPMVHATTLPVDCSSDILTCINDILRDQADNRLCYQLDPEMFAYLRWLVVTGEPKGKQRRPSLEVASDFLFPSNSCVVAAPQADGVKCAQKY